LIGIFLVTLLYMVPVLGLISLGVVSVWGLGGAVTAAFGGWRKEARDKKMSATAPSAPISPVPESFAATGTTFSSISPVAEPGRASPDPLTGSPEAISGAATVPPSGAGAHPGLNVPEVFAYPRAGFWERMGAGFLDIILISFIVALLPNPPLRFLATLAYFAGLWAWRGTTVGGVVLGLKVVRLDGQPVSFVVSIVRSLAAAFSIVVFFLGFLWIVFDREKQAWHDKIAGTAVIKMPKGTSLVMF
jgi:uncharacterized RDD family membrane protein YckC